jgi:PAS domain S-box-containing protein
MMNRGNLMDRSPVPMAELEGPSHIMRYVNPAFCRLLGKSQAALTGKPFAETMEDKNRCLALLDRVYLTGEPETHSEEGHSEIGSPYWSCAMWPVLDAAQHPVSVMMLVTETTRFHQQASEMNEALLLSSVRQHEFIEAAEKLGDQLGAQIVAHKRTEEALRLSEEHFRQSIKNAPIPVIMQAEDGEVIEVSKTWTELTGYAREEIKTVNDRLNRAFDPGADAVREHVRGLFAGQSSIEPTEFEIETQSGECRCWVFSAWPVGTLFDGRRYVVGTALDVTDRKQAEEALRENEARLEFTLESAKGGDWDLDLVTGKAVTSLRHDQCFGATEPIADWSYEKFLSYVHPNDRENEDRKFQTAVASGQDWNIDCRVIWADGSIHWIESSGRNYRYVAGKPTRMLGMVRDVTDRKRAEEATARLAAIVEFSDDAIISKDLQGVITTWNEGAERLFGYTSQEAIGQSVTMLIPPDHINEEPSILARIRRGESVQHYETVRQRKDGTLLDISLTVSPIFDRQGRIVGASKVARDITERIQAEEALRESEERYRLLVEGAPDYAIFLIDPANVITYWSSGAERVFGWSAEEAVGQNGNLIFTPEDRVGKQEEIEVAAALRDGHAPDRRWHLRKDGTRIWVDGVMRRLDDEDGHLRGFAKIARNATEQRVAEEELRKSHAHLERRVRERTADLTRTNRRLQAEMKERAQLEQEILLISEREKRRIGQDLHDGLCQELAAAAFFLKASAQKVARKNPAQAEELIKAAKIVNDNVGLARDLARGLHPIELSATGLTSALHELAFRSSQNGITCRFNYPKPMRMRDESSALNLYRIAQEAVANALKHGKPSEIVIALSRKKKAVVLEVKDNGTGLAKKRNPKGMGVHIMKYRAATIGATFTTESGRRSGTIVRCVVPG